MNRRASLPGVDELFGGTAEPTRRRPTASTANDPEATARAWEGVRQLAAHEGTALEAVRRAAEGLDLPSPEVGRLLQWAVVSSGCRHVLEIGSAGGVSGRWILERLPAGGVLTSVEPDADAHQLAGRAFEGLEGGSRVRSIHGEVDTLLSRLADGAYDLVLLQADPGGYPAHLDRLRALLREGGTLVVRHLAPTGEHADALLRFVQQLSEDPGFEVAVLPVDGGIALATRLPDAGE